jgi:hypothetical protein
VTDPLVELEGLLKHAQEVAEQLQFGDALAHAQRQVEEHKDIPESVVQLTAVVASIAPLSTEVLQTTLTLSTRLSDCAKEINTITDREGLKKIQHPLREATNAVDALRTALTSQWNARVRERFEPIATVGQVLESIDSTRAFGGELKRWAREAPAPKGQLQWAPQAPDIEVLKRMDAELTQRRESLRSAGIDEDVQTFLLAVSRGEATLSDVDAKVLAWLKNNNAAGRFAITPRVNSNQPAPRGGRGPSG